MTINPDFASPCGLYCGVCAIHMAHKDNNEKFDVKRGWIWTRKDDPLTIRAFGIWRR